MGAVDKQSRTISVKVNGTEAKYVERQKEEFEWIMPENSTVHNVVPFHKGEKGASGREKKKRSYTLIAVISTAVLLGTGFGMGMIQLLTSEGSAPQKTAPVVNTANTGEQDQGLETKESTAAPLPSLVLYFVQGGAFSVKEKGEAALAGYREKGLGGALKPAEDKYLLVMGMAHDEQTVDELMVQYKEKGIPVLKKKWEISALKEDKQYSSLLADVQSLYTELVTYVATVQMDKKVDEKEVQSIEKKWKKIEKEGKAIKRKDIQKLLTYTSVAVQTAKTGKNDIETVTKLEQMIVDGLLSYENIVSEKEKSYNN